MTTQVEVTRDREIACQVMADFLGLDVADISPDCRGAQLIREGLKRARLTAEQAKNAEIERARAEAFEEAAKLAEAHYELHPATTVRAVNYRHAGRRIATAIRNLTKGPTDADG